MQLLSQIIISNILIGDMGFGLLTLYLSKRIGGNCLRFASPAEADCRLGGLGDWRLGGLEKQKDYYFAKVGPEG